jgi:superfamily II DNA or RNA helicase
VHADLDGLAPVLRRVTDADLRDLAGERTFVRGRAYADERRVSALTVETGLALSGTVRGSGATYRADVAFESDGSVYGGECTCPVGLDCKHVVALALTARALAGGAPVSPTARRQGHLGVVPPAPEVPSWERVLGGVLRAAAQPAPTGVPLGLLVELAQRRTGPYGAGPDPGVALSVRPVVPGRTGWVKSGVSWSGLEYPRYGAPRLDPAHVEAAMRLVHARGPAYRHYAVGERLDLAAVGHGWLDALAHCRRAGVALLTDAKRGGEVVLAATSAAVVFDLVRTADGGLRLTPAYGLPDDVRRPGLEWSAFGAPPSGLVARDGADLLLAGFDEPVDVETGRVLAHGTVEVPAAQAERFRTVAVPVLAKRFRMLSPDGSVEITAPAPPRLRLEVTHLAGLQLGLAWSFTYAVGDTLLAVELDGADHAGLRDAAAEEALVGAVHPVLPARVRRPAHPGATPWPYPRSTLGGFDVVEFLSRSVPALEAVDGVEVVVGGTPVEYAEATQAPQVQLALTESDGERDWFDLTVEVTVGAEHVPMALLVTALTLGEPQVILPSGTWFRVDRPELAELRRLLDEARAMQEDDRGPLRLSPYQADLWSELEALGVVREQADRWSAVVRALGAAGQDPLPPPPGLEADLRPYQHEGFEWLTYLRRCGLGGVLADDMGLGKTVQTLAMILQERADAAEPGHEGGQETGPAWLVVAPTSVMRAWSDEAARFAPDLRVRVLGETVARRGRSVAEAAAGVDVVVTSYAVLRLDAEQFLDVRWAGLVLDEAQMVKNHQSVTYQCARRLDAPSRFAISGTPMENNLMELWSLLSITAPGLFPDPRRFAEFYRRPIESGEAPERLDTLRRRIRPVMLRRTKQAVASDLPPKQEQVVVVDLPAKHRRIYDRGLARERQRVLGLLEDANRNRIAIFRSLTMLRQLSLHPGLVDPADDAVPCAKIDTLCELLLPVVAEGHQALVFSQFTRFLGRVRDRLGETGTSYAYLDGRTRDRGAVIDRFRSGEASVFLISLKAGGTGLTLTEADYVFLLDPWWNPAVEAQAVDRTHRIGQQRPVNVYRFVSAATIEEKVLALQERKRELFASVVDEGALSGGALTAEDIRSLVQ